MVNGRKKDFQTNIILEELNLDLHVNHVKERIMITKLLTACGGSTAYTASKITALLEKLLNTTILTGLTT